MKQLRLSEEQLAAMLAKAKVRAVTPMAVKAPVRGPGKKPKVPRVKKEDRWAGMLAQQIMLAGLESPKREFKFAECLNRRFRADLAWPERMFLVEVDGGVHAIRSRWVSTVEKGQIAQQLGYRVLTVMPEQVKSGEALRLVEEALAR